MSTVVESFNRERGAAALRFNHAGLPVYDPPCRWPTPGNELTGLRVSVDQRRLAGHGNGGNCVSRVRRAPCVQIALRGCIPNSKRSTRARAKTADAKLRSRVPGESPFKSGRVSFGLSSFRDTFVTDCDFDGTLICKKKKKKEGRKELEGVRAKIITKEYLLLSYRGIL